jgi:mRNA deadenylase 3'-5' endonuclease subunit Ccr4
LEKEDPDYPKLPALDSWTPDLKEPVQSAYSKILEGNEPKFTNLARHVGGDLFVGTLDYIFCSPSCEVLEVLRLSDIFDESSPYPNANEPSDHVMIASTVRI